MSQCVKYKVIAQDPAALNVRWYDDTRRTSVFQGFSPFLSLADGIIE